MGTYRLFGSTNGPSTALAGVTGSTLMGVMFEVTTGGCWLDGYWWWVCPSGQTTAPQTFALWLTYDALPADSGALVPGSTATSAELVPGQWNFVPLPSPVPLSIGAFYVAMTGITGGYPYTPYAWGSDATHTALYPNGIVNGPLTAPSESAAITQDSGFQQAPVLAGAGTNPTMHLPVYSGYQFANYWIDPQITTEAPAGTAYRLWPSMPVVGGNGGRATDPPDVSEQSAGTEFWLSGQYAAYTLDKIWFWSPIASASTSGDPAAAIFPDRCAIFDIATKAIVPGTENNPPDWRNPDGSPAKPGNGWVYSAYTGITLPPGKYKTAVYCYAGGLSPVGDLTSYVYFGELPFYFGAEPSSGKPGPAGVNGIVNGPLSSPDVASASDATGYQINGMSNGIVPGNSTYQNNDATNTGTFLYPDSFDEKDFGETRWIDVEVTPVPQPAPPAAAGGMLTFFP